MEIECVRSLLYGAWLVIYFHKLGLAQLHIHTSSLCEACILLLQTGSRIYTRGGLPLCLKEKIISIYYLYNSRSSSLFR